MSDHPTRIKGPKDKYAIMCEYIEDEAWQVKVVYTTKSITSARRFLDLQMKNNKHKVTTGYYMEKVPEETKGKNLSNKVFIELLKK
jgi:hypothetical protein